MAKYYREIGALFWDGSLFFYFLLIVFTWNQFVDLTDSIKKFHFVFYPDALKLLSIFQSDNCSFGTR